MSNWKSRDKKEGGEEKRNHKNLAVVDASPSGKVVSFFPGVATNRGKLILLALLFLSSVSIAQTASHKPSGLPTQQLRGIVLDQVLQKPMEGATVSLPALNKTTSTGPDGSFHFMDIPVGTYQLVASFSGYKDAAIENISLNSGKETVLNIPLESNIKLEDEVVVKAPGRKNKPLNEMSAVSARAFSVEETQKYAAAVNDPSRMATGFPGVMSTDDGNNNISIRGNSPTGLLWRMEGVDIPNPNHFGSTGSSGGGISILSAQLLSNSDFITSAFAAEYGNALSGVFDLHLRKGNNERREYTLEAGLLGLNVAAEGPFSHSYSGSYLVNYRYSTLQLLNKIGVPLEGGATNFQDLSYNIYLPTRRMGTFTVFGFGGLSSQDDKAKLDSSKWTDKNERYNSEFVSNTAAAGATHSIMIGRRSNLRTALVYSYNRIGDLYNYVQDDYSLREDYEDSYRTSKLTLSSTLNEKISDRITFRGGAIVNLIGFNYYEKSKENDTAPLEEKINTKDHTQTVQAFAQVQYKFMQNLSLIGGFHYLQLLYNNSYSVEPRFSLRWKLSNSNSVALAYGGHSQIQALGVYFAQEMNASGQLIYPNKELGLTKANHYVFSFQHAFNRNLTLKTEVYYQQLYKVPVSVFDSSTFSVLNVQSDYVTDPLVNSGKGRNYGVEFSLEKYLSNHFYYTVSTSLFESKYKAKDGVERNTRFNSNHISNLVIGKEFLSANRLRSFGVNIKAVYAGGLRETPVDVPASVQEGHAIYKEQEAYTIQNPDYFRTDLRLSLKWNRKRLTSVLSLDIQNITNRLNVYGSWFDSDKGQMVTSYQNGLIPILNYRVEF